MLAEQTTKILRDGLDIVSELPNIGTDFLIITMRTDNKTQTKPTNTQEERAELIRRAHPAQLFLRRWRNRHATFFTIPIRFFLFLQ